MPLTTEQKELWDSDNKPRQGLHVVSARAGTGKTTLLTQYCLDIAKNWEQMGFKGWQGMAILSYTNVAKNELEVKIKNEKKGFNLLEPPNTIQTLDSFLNERVFLPYGNAAMGSLADKPTLAGEPYRPLALKDGSVRIATKNNPRLFTLSTILPAYYFDKLAYNLSGDIVPTFGTMKHVQNKWRIIDTRGEDTFVIDWTLKDGKPSQAQKTMLNYKIKCNVDGLASQADANYFALLALENSERITRSLIKRFPVIIIDEAQDMTEIQHAILDHLVDKGLKNVVIVGDDHQAIYEWNTARPELFTSKYDASSTAWESHEITETFRNSQNICKALNSLAKVTDIKPSKYAKSIKRAYEDPVYIIDWKYTPRDAMTFRAILEDCAKHISGKLLPHNDREKTLAVIMRSSKDIEVLRAMFGDRDKQSKQEQLHFVNQESRDTLKLLYSFKNGSKGEMAKRYEGLLLTLHKKESVTDLRKSIIPMIDIEYDDEYFSYRKALHHDIAVLRKHINDAAGKLSALADIDRLSLLCVAAGSLSNIKDDYSDIKYTAHTLDGIFMEKANRLPEYHPAYPDVRLVFSTAHGVKGETHDGVLFIQKHMGNTCKCNPPQMLPIEISGHTLECEEKRIQYVAMSRAAQTLWLAADPNSYSRKPSDVERWKDKAGGELSPFQSLEFGRLLRQKMHDLEYADADLSKALLSCEFSRDEGCLTIFVTASKKAKDYIAANQKIVKDFIGIHLPEINDVDIITNPS